MSLGTPATLFSSWIHFYVLLDDVCRSIKQYLLFRAGAGVTGVFVDMRVVAVPQGAGPGQTCEQEAVPNDRMPHPSLLFSAPSHQRGFHTAVSPQVPVQGLE